MQVFPVLGAPTPQALLYYGRRVSSSDPAKLLLGTFNGGTSDVDAARPSECLHIGVRVHRGRLTAKTASLPATEICAASAMSSPPPSARTFRCFRAASCPTRSRTSQKVGWSPNSKWIALRADRDVDTQFDLYLIRWSAPGIAHKPHANSIGSGVTNWAFAPNSQSSPSSAPLPPRTTRGSTSASCQRVALLQRPRSSPPPPAPSSKPTSTGCPARASSPIEPRSPARLSSSRFPLLPMAQLAAPSRSAA